MSDFYADGYGMRPLFSRSRTDAHIVQLPAMTLYFSYSSLVAFTHPERGLVCIENQWGPTTGKHLNGIESDKKRRVSPKEFERLLGEVRGLLVAARLNGGA